MISFAAGFILAALVALLLQGRMYMLVARATFKRIHEMSPAVQSLKDKVTALIASVEKLSLTIGSRTPQNLDDQGALTQLNASVDGLKTKVDGLNSQLNPGTSPTSTPTFPFPWNFL